MQASHKKFILDVELFCPVSFTGIAIVSKSNDCNR